MFIVYYLTSISTFVFFVFLQSLNLGHGISAGKNLYLRHTKIWVYQFQFKIFPKKILFTKNSFYKEFPKNSKSFLVFVGSEGCTDWVLSAMQELSVQGETKLQIHCP